MSKQRAGSPGCCQGLKCAGARQLNVAVVARIGQVVLFGLSRPHDVLPSYRPPDVPTALTLTGLVLRTPIALPGQRPRDTPPPLPRQPCVAYWVLPLRGEIPEVRCICAPFPPEVLRSPLRSNVSCQFQDTRISTPDDKRSAWPPLLGLL